MGTKNPAVRGRSRRVGLAGVVRIGRTERVCRHRLERIANAAIYLRRIRDATAASRALRDLPGFVSISVSVIIFIPFKISSHNLFLLLLKPILFLLISQFFHPS